MRSPLGELEFAVPDSADEGGPLDRIERQHGPGRVLGITDQDLPVFDEDFDAPVRATERALLPTRARRSVHGHSSLTFSVKNSSDSVGSSALAWRLSKSVVYRRRASGSSR